MIATHASRIPVRVWSVPCLPLLWLLMVAGGGCHGKRVEEAEHSIPAHKPADFRAAVDRLAVLQQEIFQGPVARESGQLDALVELHDIVRWLPDLAADSDLNEQAWNRVHAVAGQWQTLLMDSLAQSGDARREAYLRQRAQVEEHQRVLVEVKQLLPPPAEPVAAEDAPQG